MSEPRQRGRIHPILACALVTILLAAIAWSGWRVAAELRASGHWRAAQAALAGEDFPTAREHLEACLRAWPDNPEVHFVAAQAARRNGDLPDAIRLLETAEKLDWVPEAVDLERMLTRVALGDLAEFEKPLGSFVADDHPDKALILEVLAPAYLRNYQLGPARHFADLWTKEKPDSEAAFSCLGAVAQRQRDRKGALAAFRRSVELAPESYEVRLRLVRILLEMFESTEALEHIRYLLERHPDDLIVRREYACCLCLRGEGSKARPVLNEVLLQRPDDFEALSARGRLELRDNHPIEAERWLRMAAERAPHEQSVVYPFLRCLRRNGKETEARRWEERLNQVIADMTRLDKVTQAAAEARSDPEPRREAGVIFLRNGQEEEGLRWLVSALHQDPNHAATHEALADYYERKGDKIRAANHRARSQRNQASPGPVPADKPGPG